MLKLIVVEPSGNEQRVTLDRDEYILGRDPTVSIPLRDRKVSRQHARIFRKGSALYIEDLGSVNGVLVGGATIQCPRKLTPGLELDVGGFILTVVTDANQATCGDGWDDGEDFAEDDEFILGGANELDAALKIEVDDKAPTRNR